MVAGKEGVHIRCMLRCGQVLQKKAITGVLRWATTEEKGCFCDARRCGATGGGVGGSAKKEVGEGLQQFTVEVNKEQGGTLFFKSARRCGW